MKGGHDGLMKRKTTGGTYQCHGFAEHDRFWKKAYLKALPWIYSPRVCGSEVWEAAWPLSGDIYSKRDRDPVPGRV